MKPRVAALVVAAGAGRRMGFDKIVAPLAGRPVVQWSLDAFQQCPDVHLGALVCAAGRRSEFEEYCAPFPKFRLIVSGGAERSDSVINGLEALAAEGAEFVAVHDAARPLIRPEVITQVIQAALDCGAAVAAEPASDTMHRANGDILFETVPRDGIWSMQTPQVARLTDLRQALSAARLADRPVTDEMSALLLAGHRPRAIPHGTLNFKITWPRDLDLAQRILG